jgi:hypothetical protein
MDVACVAALGGRGWGKEGKGGRNSPLPPPQSPLPSRYLLAITQDHMDSIYRRLTRHSLSRVT